MSPAVRLIAVFALLASPGYSPAAEPCEEAVAAVLAWYDTIGDGSNQAEMSGFGTVGDGPQPLAEAYQQLHPSLRQRMSELGFFVYFRGLARLRLLQVRPSCDGQPPESAKILVEEERTLVIEGIPAVAWYWGLLTLTRTPQGWQISDLDDIHPEDIISLPLGGHMPYRRNPAEVARAYLKCADPAKCEVIETLMHTHGVPVALPNANSGPARTVIRPDGSLGTVARPARKATAYVNWNGQTATVTLEVNGTRRAVDLTQLHSREWVAFRELRQK